LKVDCLDQPSVRWNSVARAQENDIPGDDLPCRHLAVCAVSHDAGDRSGQLAKCLDRAFGTVLLEEAEQHGEEDDDGDGRRFEAVSEPRGQRHGDLQNDDENILELADQHHPWRHLLGGAQLVGSVLP